MTPQFAVGVSSAACKLQEENFLEPKPVGESEVGEFREFLFDWGT